MVDDFLSSMAFLGGFPLAMFHSWKGNSPSSLRKNITLQLLQLLIRPIDGFLNRVWLLIKPAHANT
jgi:hypothetical protein